MQRIDFVKAFTDLTVLLRSTAILRVLEPGFTGNQKGPDYAEIVNVFFESKEGYYNAVKDPVKLKILEAFGAIPLYENKSLAYITAIFPSRQPKDLFVDDAIRNFWFLHYSLYKLGNLLQEELVKRDFLNEPLFQVTQGLIAFRIINSSAGIDPGILANIFNAIKELFKAVGEINGINDEKVEIVLLDSGSDINTIVKTSAETARSVFLIFKEMWDFFTNKKHYKHKQDMQSIMESLSVREEIKKKEDAGVLSSEEAKRLIHMVRSRTDELLNLHTIPKFLVDSEDQESQTKLLETIRETRLLGSGDENAQ